ncbi:alpha/beta hydrolase family protein [Virgisporangium aurantiacum]|uniref:alpha/beta hydrolase family protein n=1 Tax=Virgisporangium aurantiacum TaxID=175570 RepID=UPI001951FAFD|nr:dienelactone hydrolase family protein [Virgisporangium aurantiacum]
MTTSIAGAPVLLTSVQAPEVAARRGAVLVYHGFGGDKSQLGDLAGALADAGFLVVRVDAVGHGDRRRPDWDQVFSEQRWAEAEDETEAEFLALLTATAAEVPAIVDELVASGRAHEGRLGITGRSLGGEISYAAVLAEPRIRAAAPMVGSPEWTLPWPDSPHRHPERFYPVPILAHGAELDQFVPARYIRDFHDRLTPLYAQGPDRLRYVEYPGVDHFLTPELWRETHQRVVAWFDRWLTP